MRDRVADRVIDVSSFRVKERHERPAAYETQPHTRLSEEPLSPTAQVTASTLGRYTEIAERAKVSECELGDYSYMMQECEVWAARIGKFANIASHVRINATNHPVWRATLHHFTYRANDYWADAGREESFFDWRRSNAVVIGHDVWIGHGATILPGVTIGNGAVIGAARSSAVSAGLDDLSAARAGEADPRAVHARDRRAHGPPRLVGLEP